MKRTLIAIASAGFLTSTAWVVAANAQANINPNVYPGNMNMGERYGARAPAYAPAPAYGPSRRYARRAYRRSARPSYGAPGAPPGTYAGNTAFTPGSGGQPYAVTPGAYAANSAQPNEWYGPMRRGNMCTTHVDINRGYGYQAACKK